MSPWDSWEDSHLLEFAYWAGLLRSGTEHYLCPFMVEDGGEGVPEEHVRIDEVLVEPNDRLQYLYDFGDGWHHLIRLEEVAPLSGGTPRAVSVTGRRPGPYEDCGGISGCELIVAADDPSHPHHHESLAEYVDMYFEDADPAVYLPTPFDIGAINSTLRKVVNR